MNFKIKLDGKKFKNAFVSTFQGQTAAKRCLCIPIDDNDFYISDKTGAVYIDLIAWEDKIPKDYRTHAIQISLSKEKRDSLSKEERDALYIGSMLPFSQQTAEPTPNLSTQLQQITPDATVKPSEDLPF